MRRPIALWLVLLAAAAAGPAAAQVADWRQVPIRPLKPFVPQEPTRVVLPNGLVLFLMEDHELPLVKGWASIRGGSRDEPAQKLGLVDVYGQVWRTGGTASRTGDELDDYLEARAAKVETDGDTDSTTISFDCLKENLDDVFPVFVELLEKPAFRADKIELARKQIDTGIARRNDNPAGIAAREARMLGYGKDSPYAREPEYATVAAVTRDDLVRWHDDHVHPNDLILGVVGDFDAKTMEARIRQALGAWPRGPAARPFEGGIEPAKPGVYFVEKADVNQSNIRMVHLGTTKDNPDYYALQVMNEVFGGGLSSRLFSNVRSKKGLAYAVGGGVGTDFDHPGLFMVSMGTKSGTTGAAIEALYEEIRNLTAEPATAEELKRAKDSILNSFIFRFDSRAKVLGERMLYEFYGYPPDFLERYRAGIEKVTTEDVARVARKYVHEDQIALLVVGKAEDFDEPLSSFGKVTTLDVSTPEPGGKKPALQSDPAGRELLGKVIEGLGGAAAISSLKAVRQTASARMQTPQGQVEIGLTALTVFPDSLRQERQTPMGAVSVVVSPEAAFIETPMGIHDLPAMQKEALLRDLRSSPLYVARFSHDAAVAVRSAGSETVAGVEARILDVASFGAEARWWVDPATGHVIRSAAQVAGMGPPVEQVTDFSDFRPVDGLVLPFHRSILRDGEAAGVVETSDVEVNPAVDPRAFEKPAAQPAQ
jgi:zinc protease